MDSCTTCKVWMQEKETLLKDCNSVFEAVSRLHEFEQGCSMNCLFNGTQEIKQTGLTLK